MPVDLSNIQKRAYAFFNDRSEKFYGSTAQHICSNLTIDQLLQCTPTIEASIVDKYFPDDRADEVSVETVAQTRGTLHEIRKTINNFPQSKRFFILQTIDFFNTPNHIDKVIPALLRLENDEQKHDVLDFVYSTFSTLNKNIETIISIPEMFPQASLHIERGGLYTLSSDIAGSICSLFAEDFRSGFKNNISNVERVLNIFKPYRYRAGTSIESAAMTPVQHLIKPETTLRNASLSFISQVQTHNSLLLYSKKRYLFYKQFLKQILTKARFNRLEPAVSSIILAGCLISNPQLTPQKELLEQMTTESLFVTAETRKSYCSFVDQLAPTTVFNIIGDYKQSVSDIAAGKNVSGTDPDKSWKAKSFYQKLRGKILKSNGQTP